MTVTVDLQPIENAGNRSGIVAVFCTVKCALRGLPMFIAARPKTPLRVLCVMAFDTLHVLRMSERMPEHRAKTLVALLDFGACTNAELDGKKFSEDDYQSARRQLETAGVGVTVDEYVRRLKELERQRPTLGGDLQQFQDARRYRESVVRLSLGIVAATAFGDQDLEKWIEATQCNDDLSTLFRIVMQCQIIDDVVDYSKDLSAGLPGFLTAPTSLSRAFEWTNQSARQYADDRGLSRSSDEFPLRLALSVVSVVARIACFVA